MPDLPLVGRSKFAKRKRSKFRVGAYADRVMRENPHPYPPHKGEGELLTHESV
jgi:hypothetical protein